MEKEKNKKEENEAVDEIIIEDENNGITNELVKKIREKLKKCEAERLEYLSGWQRAKADFINARKEEEEKREEFIKFSEKELILRFLDLADSFDRLFADKKAWETINKNWRQGVENLHSQFANILKSRGVEAIDAIGKKFNPYEHHSAGEIKVDKAGKEGIVMEELRRGYKMQGLVVRPSLVKIGKF